MDHGIDEEALLGADDDDHDAQEEEDDDGDDDGASPTEDGNWVLQTLQERGLTFGSLSVSQSETKNLCSCDSFIHSFINRSIHPFIHGFIL